MKQWKSIWLRRGRALSTIGLVAGLSVGCSKTGEADPTPPDTVRGSGSLSEIRAVGQQLSAPFDASPTPKADGLYFTALTTVDQDEASGALFRAGTGANSAPQMLASGFNAPIGLIVSRDGSSIYVADISVQSETDERSGGVIYSVASTGGTPTELAGTAGYHARSMDIIDENGRDRLYFSGNDPNDGQPGIFSTDATGASVAVVKKGEPLSDPSGLAVAENGDIYFADTSASDSAPGVYRLSGGDVTEIVAIPVGYPAGVALSQDEQYLLVSGHLEGAAQAAVYRVELATGKATALTMGLEGNKASGGVHRAHDADVYAWSNADAPDRAGKGGGTVFLIGTEAAALPQ